MVKDKEKFALWLSPEVKEDVAQSYRKYGAKSQSEFIESAIVFYLAYLRAEEDAVFLPEEIDKAIKRVLDPVVQRMGSVLFKVAVEQDIGNHILAYDTDIDLPTLDVTADGERVDTKVKVELPAADEGQMLVLVDAEGNETVIKKSLVEDGKVYAEIPAGATVKVVEADGVEFGDVADSAWYADAVEFVASHELFQGTNNGFEPDTTMNRAMLVTVLYRLEDASASGGSTFADVDPVSWYAEAVAWADETGIVTGTDNGFEPNAPVTREQIATILYRYANVIGLDTSTKSSLSGFPDGGETSNWASGAMQWAVSVGLFQGDGHGALNPKGDATRAQVATLFERLVGLIVK